MKLLPVLLGAVITCWTTTAVADEAAVNRPALKIEAVDDAQIRLDGQLDEPIWKRVVGQKQMTILQPDVLEQPRFNTDTRLFYTDQGLYVGITAEQPLDTLLPRLSSRDVDINRDGTAFYLDTSGEGLYGFFFGVNLGGTLMDGTLLPERQISRLWDGPWQGHSVPTDTGYTTEMFLPWSMMQMPELDTDRTMAYYVSRHVAHLDEEWGWPALPSTRSAFLSGFKKVQLGKVKPRKQLAFYPFSAASYNRTYQSSGYRIGTDIFWRPTSNLQVTATLNPDFGTVESDDVVVNLTAFETFFPEKRLFFLEGNEIFITSPRAQSRSSSSGTGARPTPNTFFLEPTTLMNTRRIGGSPREPVVPAGITVSGAELGKPTELIAATKLTGQAGPFRYGVLAAAENDTVFYGTDTLGNPAQLSQSGRNFGVMRWLYEDSSNGRRAVGILSTRTDHDRANARTQGIDLHYLSPRGNFFWDAQIMRSDIRDLDDPARNGEGYGAYIDFNYIPSRGYFNKLSLDYLDDKLDVSDLGFIRRNDDVTVRYTFNRSNSDLAHLRTLTNTITFSYVTNTDQQRTRTNIWYRNQRTFHNKNQLTITGMYILPGWDDRQSRGNGTYETEGGITAEIAYGTDTSRPLSTSIGINATPEVFGEYTYTLKGGFTFKPNDRLSLDLDLNIRKTTDWLLHVAGNTMATYQANHVQPKLAADLFISAKQQLRFSLQWVGIKAKARKLYSVAAVDGPLVSAGPAATPYNFTISRLTSQIRYRWEIAPLSDLFVVYTRGSNLPNRTQDSFGDLFHDSLTTPVIDLFVVKLRYRFGN